MSPDKAKLFLLALGRKSEYDGSQWVRAACPLAPWTHQNGKDSNPSFGVSARQGHQSYFHCFSCQSGGLEQLLNTMEYYAGKDGTGKEYDFARARLLLSEDVDEVLPLPDFTEFDGEDQGFQEWPSYFLKAYSAWSWNKQCREYVQSRGVSASQADKFDLRYDPHRNMVMSPYRNVYGAMAGARGRAIDDNPYKHHDYTCNKVNNAAYVWYNEGVLEHEEPTVIVEGQFDLYTVEQVYPHVIANLTAKPKRSKMQRLAQCPGIILLLDNDKPGKDATVRFLKYFDEHKMPVAVATLPPEFKDSNQAGPDAVRDALIAIGMTP